jgi:hypothetical protein
MGKIRSVIKKPGCHHSFAVCGRELQYVNTSIQSILLKGSSVPDFHGSPLIVSCTVIYRIEDGIKATYGIADLN